MTRSLRSESGHTGGIRTRVGILALSLSLILLLAACSPAGGGGTGTSCEYGSGTYGNCVYGP